MLQMDALRKVVAAKKRLEKVAVEEMMVKETTEVQQLDVPSHTYKKGADDQPLPSHGPLVPGVGSRWKWRM